MDKATHIHSRPFAPIVQRLRPLTRQDDWSRTSVRRLTQEIDRLSEMLGL